MTMLLPCPGVVAALGADIGNSGDLHTVLPLGRTLDSQTVTDVDTDMACSPYHLTDLHAIPAGGRSVRTLLNHAVCPNVRDIVGGILGTAIGSVLIAIPAP